MILLKRKPVSRILAGAVAIVCVGSLAWTVLQLARQHGGAAHRETEDALTEQLGMNVRFASMRRLSTSRIEFNNLSIQPPDSEKILLSCRHAVWADGEADAVARLTLRGVRLHLGGTDWDERLTRRVSEHLGRLGKRRVRIIVEDASFHLPLGRFSLHVEQASGTLALQPAGPWPLDLQCGMIQGIATSRPAAIHIELQPGGPQLVKSAGITELSLPAADGPPRFEGDIEFTAGERDGGSVKISGRLTDPALAKDLGAGELTQWVSGSDLQIKSMTLADGRLDDCTLAGRIELSDVMGATGTVNIDSLKIQGRRIQELILSHKPAGATTHLSGLRLADLCKSIGLDPAAGTLDATFHGFRWIDGRVREMDVEVRSATSAGKRYIGPGTVALLSQFFFEGELALPESVGRMPFEPLAIRVVVLDGQVRYHCLSGDEDRALLRLTVPNVFEREWWPTFTIRQDGAPPRPVPMHRAKHAWLGILKKLKIPNIARDLFDLPPADAQSRGR